MKKLLLLGCLLAGTGSPARAQVGRADVVVVRFYYGGYGGLNAVIARGPAPRETLKTKGGAPEEAQFYQQVIARLYREGYVLKMTFSFGAYNQSPWSSPRTRDAGGPGPLTVGATTQTVSFLKPSRTTQAPQQLVLQ
ncbi:MAG: hypothetical protein NVS3B25_32730 [Hymenobacter sp.]